MITWLFGLRRHTAINNALRTKSTCIFGCMDQPTTCRENSIGKNGNLAAFVAWFVVTDLCFETLLLHQAGNTIYAARFAKLAEVFVDLAIAIDAALSTHNCLMSPNSRSSSFCRADFGWLSQA